MEATGGYEKQAFSLLWEAGISCSLVNPRAVRQFAQAMGSLEKTDLIDAQMMARFAIAKDIKPTPLSSRTRQRLKDFAKRLQQVTSDITVQKQRLSATKNPDMIRSLNEVIALLKKQAKSFEGEIASLIDEDPLWAKLDEAFRSIKGVAGRTVARLMANLPEIGVYSNKAISKLVGLAPIAKDSGSRNGKRHIQGGRGQGGRDDVRSILFVVAKIASKYDETLHAFGARLLKAGKPVMVVRVALAHKRLVRLNAKARIARAEFVNPT